MAKYQFRVSRNSRKISKTENINLTKIFQYDENANFSSPLRYIIHNSGKAIKGKQPKSEQNGLTFFIFQHFSWNIAKFVPAIKTISKHQTENLCILTNASWFELCMSKKPIYIFYIVHASVYNDSCSQNKLRAYPNRVYSEIFQLIAVKNTVVAAVKVSVFFISTAHYHAELFFDALQFIFRKLLLTNLPLTALMKLLCIKRHKKTTSKCDLYHHCVYVFIQVHLYSDKVGLLLPS